MSVSMLFIILVMVFIGYICVHAIIDRICKCIEYCARLKYLRSEELTKEIIEDAMYS